MITDFMIGLGFLGLLMVLLEQKREIDIMAKRMDELNGNHKIIAAEMDRLDNNSEWLHSEIEKINKGENK